MRITYDKLIAIALAAMMLLCIVPLMPGTSGAPETGWTQLVVYDTPSSSILDENSIALDAEGHVYIAFALDIGNGGYYHLYLTTNASGSWTTQLVDGMAYTGLHSDMAIDSDNHIHIAYFDYNNYCVKYATNTSGTWVNETVDPHDPTGTYGLSMALDSAGEPHIAYSNVSYVYNSTTTFNDQIYSIELAEKVDGVWQHTQLDAGDSGRQIGVDISYSIDTNNHGHMSYLRNHTLGYNTNETGSWAVDILDPTFESGWDSSLAIDSSGHIGISYYISSTKLMYITNASGPWVNETVSESGTSGKTYLVIDSGGNPSILTYVSGTLELFTKSGSTWGHIYPSDQSYVGPSSLAIDGRDKFHIGFSKTDMYYLTNSIETDTTAPVITITTPTSDATYSTTIDHVTVGGSCSDDIGVSSITWTNSLGGSGSAVVGATWSVSVPLSVGTNVITVTAHDAAGHSTAVILTVYYSLDTSDPTVTITDPDPLNVYNTSVDHIPASGISGTASDDVGVVAMSIENMANSATTSIVTGNSYVTWSTSGNLALNPGLNTINITAEDAAGNVGTATLTVNYTAESNGPTVAITSPEDDSIIDSTTVTVEWTGSDDTGIQGYQYSLDGADWSGMSLDEEHTFEGLAQGGHIVIVKAVDLDDNVMTASVSFVVDTIDPTISSISPSNGTVTNSSAISWAGHDVQSGIAYYIVNVDNGTWSGHLTVVTYEFTGLDDGYHFVRIRAYDLAGHYTEQSFGFILDTTPPELGITVPTTEGTYTANGSALTVNGTATDYNSVTEIKWINSKGGSGTATVTGGEWSISSIELKKGTNVITITASDSGNNTATTTLSVVYEPDQKESGIGIGTISLIIILIIMLVLVAFYIVRRGKKR